MLTMSFVVLLFVSIVPFNFKSAYAVESYSFVEKWGMTSSGSEDGQFDNPRDVAVDSQGNVYVADVENDRIQKFDSSGNFITKLGTHCDIHTQTGCVDPDGAGPLQVGDGQFYQPYGITIDSSGNVYVSDSSNDRIQKFDSSGNFITKWGSLCIIDGGQFCTGNGDGQFHGPTYIAVDSSDNVYVVDTGNDRIQKFDSSGNFITKWGSTCILRTLDHLGCTTPDGNGQFDTPFGIGVDLQNNVYVADQNNNRIQKFNSNGNFITKWGSSFCYVNSGFAGCIDPDGAGPLQVGDGQFSSLIGVTTDLQGNVYVVDAQNDRIQKFDSYGNFITKWGSGPSSDDGKFDAPAGITTDSSDNVYVTDDNIRVQKFTPSIFCGKTVDQFATIIDGTAGSDVLIGTNLNDLIVGNDGNDRLFGNAGDDCIIAGDGNNRISGGAGNDIITSGSGDDRTWGGLGNDTISAGGGNDRIVGGFGNDILDGNDGNDFIWGQAGNDTMDGGAGNDMCIDFLGTNTATSCETYYH